MKKSNKIYLQDTQESMAIIKNTLKEAFYSYNAHKNLSERHYIKIEFDTGAFIIIKMFSPDNNFDNQVGMVSVNDKRISNNNTCLITFAYNSNPNIIDVLVEEVLLEHLEMVMEYLAEDWIEIKYNLDEANPKRKYKEISIDKDYCLEEHLKEWTWYIRNLKPNQRSICSGAWNINIGTPEQTKLKFSLLAEKVNIRGLDYWYMEGIQNTDMEREVVSDEDLDDFVFSFGDYIKKLESYTLPNKKETVIVKFYIEEE